MATLAKAFMWFCSLYFRYLLGLYFFELVRGEFIAIIGPYFILFYLHFAENSFILSIVAVILYLYQFIKTNLNSANLMRI